jgi:hypothetical protein
MEQGCGYETEWWRVLIAVICRDEAGGDGREWKISAMLK